MAGPSRNVRILKSIKNGKFKPRDINDVRIGEDRKYSLDKLVGLNLRPSLPGKLGLAADFGLSYAEHYKFTRDLLRSGAVIDPNIYEMLAVFGKFDGRAYQKWRFDSRVLDTLLYRDLQKMGGNQGRMSMNKKLVDLAKSEQVKVTGTNSFKYCMAVVSRDGIPAYMNLFKEFPSTKLSILYEKLQTRLAAEISYGARRDPV